MSKTLSSHRLNQESTDNKLVVGVHGALPDRPGVVETLHVVGLVEAGMWGEDKQRRPAESDQLES